MKRGKPKMKQGVTLKIGAFETIRLDTSEHEDEFTMLSKFWDLLQVWEEYSLTATRMIKTIQKRIEEITQ